MVLCWFLLFALCPSLSVAACRPRAELLQRAEVALLDEAPMLPLYHHVRADLRSPAVQGWSPNRLDDHPYKDVWLKE